MELPKPEGDFPFLKDEAATKDILEKIITQGFDAVF
jgi:hypothetical protein